jgi:poly-beta-1,6-N-acetyl-D-glucosamine synthase
MELFDLLWGKFLFLLASPFNDGFWPFVFKFIPYVLFFEIPVYLFIFLGILRFALRRDFCDPENPVFYPRVSCVVLGYREGEELTRCILSLAEQVYPAPVEILALIDGAHQNRETLDVANRLRSKVATYPNRTLRIVPKWQRGGRVSSLNAGLRLANGEIVLALDGDTSFDNTVLHHAVQHFVDPDVVGVAGNLRVRNVGANLITRLQGIEYLFSVHGAKIGLSEFNVVNNISGAFGIFRRQFLTDIGGWDSGTAEDLDLTLRIKSYFGQHPHLKIRFEPLAIGHTDVPATCRGLLDQRLRWDGDLFYLYVRKHWLKAASSVMGLRNLIMLIWTGFLFQLVMPILILFYTVYMLLVYPIQFILPVWFLVYVVYFAMVVVFFLVFVLLVSERPREDIRLLPFLPLMPFFSFFLRIWNALATLREMTTRAHLDSSMAPWWVLKKTKF